MFDKLEDLLRRFEEIQNELSEPTVVSDQNRFRKLMKEQNDLQPLQLYQRETLFHQHIHKHQYNTAAQQHQHRKECENQKVCTV